MLLPAEAWSNEEVLAEAAGSEIQIQAVCPGMLLTAAPNLCFQSDFYQRLLMTVLCTSSPLGFAHRRQNVPFCLGVWHIISLEKCLGRLVQKVSNLQILNSVA